MDNSETVETALEQGYELAAGVEAATVEQLKRAKVAHFDETGLRVAGRLCWLHTASNSLYTHLFVHRKRGGEALRSAASVLKDFGGRAIHDCLPAYYQFEQAKHGACLAHILRELQGLVEHGSAWAAARNRYRQIVSEAELAEPAPEQKAGRGRPRSTAGRNLLRRLKEYEEAVLAFALVEGVPFTNNQAERDLQSNRK